MLVRNGHVLSENHRIQKAWEHGAWKMENGTKQGSWVSWDDVQQGKGDEESDGSARGRGRRGGEGREGKGTRGGRGEGPLVGLTWW